MAININKIKNLPLHLQIIVTALPSIVLIILFIYLIYLPKNKEIKALNTRIVKQDNEIVSSESKIKRLDALIAENALLKEKLSRLKEQLPEEKEVSELLKQISELGLKSGLVILLWKPEARKTNPQGLYVEIPVKIEVLTEYHKLGVFFSYISRLPRIVNISEIAMRIKDKSGQSSRGFINAKFVARTFASVKPEDIIGDKGTKTQ